MINAAVKIYQLNSNNTVTGLKRYRQALLCCWQILSVWMRFIRDVKSLRQEGQGIAF